jgi:hypothetical protein
MGKGQLKSQGCQTRRAAQLSKPSFGDDFLPLKVSWRGSKKTPKRQTRIKQLGHSQYGFNDDQLYLYTHHLHSGHIVALRSGIIIAIPHLAFRQFQEQENPSITLIDVLGNKKARQLFCLDRPLGLFAF